MRAIQQPRLKRTVEVIEGSSGDLYLLRPSLGEDLVVEQPPAAVRSLLGSLDGTATVARLEAGFGPKRVREVLGVLAEHGLVEDAADDLRLPPIERERFDRQLRYMSDLGGRRRAVEYQAKLGASRVLVLGVGGLGSWTTCALASCGVGAMTLIDGDTVELSNLNRQILYAEPDIGRPKTEVAAQMLSRYRSSLQLRTVQRRLESESEVHHAVSGFDLVVSGADWPAQQIERWVNRGCFAQGVPFISMSHAPPFARVGPLYVPGSTGCFACQEAEYRRAYPLYDEVVAARTARVSQAATLGPACAFVGGQVALEVMHMLSGLCEPATHAAAHIYDLRTMERTVEAVPKRPDCEVCSKHTR